MPRDPATAPRRRLRRPSRAGSGEECRGIPELLVARAEGMAGADDQALLTAHLSRCSACAALRDAFRRAEAAYREPPERVVSPEAADTIVAALMAAAPVAEPAVPAEAEPRPRRLSRRRGPETLEFPAAENGGAAADDATGPEADHEEPAEAQADDAAQIPYMARTPRRPRPPAVAPGGERSHLRAVVLPGSIIAVAIAGALVMAGVFGEDEAPPTSPSSDQLFPTAVIRAPERGTAAAAAAEIARQAQLERLRIARERAARSALGSTAAVPATGPAAAPGVTPAVPPSGAAAAGPSSATATPTPATSATAVPTPVLP